MGSAGQGRGRESLGRAAGGAQLAGWGGAEAAAAAGRGQGGGPAAARARAHSLPARTRARPGRGRHSRKAARARHAHSPPRPPAAAFKDANSAGRRWTPEAEVREGAEACRRPRPPPRFALFPETSSPTRGWRPRPWGERGWG